MQQILMAQIYGGRGGIDERKATFTMGDVAKALTTSSEENGKPVTLENALEMDGLVDMFCAIEPGPLSEMFEPCWGDYEDGDLKALFENVLAGKPATINCEECSYVFLLDTGADSRNDAMRLVRKAWFTMGGEDDEDGWD